MTYFKRIISISLALVMLLSIVLTGCAPTVKNSDDGKLKIVATIFPQYDFARQIGGDKADVTMLLPPGMESHSFEPTPADVIAINNADIFIYTGEDMESWADEMTDGIDNGNVNVLDVSQNIELSREGDDEEEHHEGDGHVHQYDPHIWTSPKNAKIMVQTILNAMCEADSKNADYYMANAEKLTAQIAEIDEAFKEVTGSAKRNKIVFGGRFALHYFVKDYNLTHVAAFDSCSEETEPSAGKLAEIIDTVKAESIPVVYYEEMTDPKVARIIAEETGTEILLFHSCHNLSKSEIENGETYCSLMIKNIENLKKGLN